MCGIVGVLGNQDAGKIIHEGLKRLEYRGYDSAGIYLQENQQLYQAVGQLNELEKKLPLELSGNLGIGHTRWATHGKATLENTHPFISQSKRFALVHNGTIENYLILKETYLNSLQLRGQTDSEVIVELIAYFYEKSNDVYQSIQKTISLLEGSYALGIIDTQDANTLYGAKQNSPLVIGEKNQSYFLTSDPSAIMMQDVNYTEVEDGDIFKITSKNGPVFTKEKQRKNFTLETEEEYESLGNFSSYMEKEIFQQPQILEKIGKEYLIEKNYLSEELKEKIQQAKHIYFVACGTSYHASLIGKRYFEELLKIPTQVFLASEIGDELPIIEESPLFIFLSQSGETADSLSVMKNLLNLNYETLALTNVPYSTMGRMSSYVLPLLAGKEVAVASTKAYTAQLGVLFSLIAALKPEYQKEFLFLPEKMTNVLKSSSDFNNELQPFLKEKGNLIFIGRKYDWDVALEGALKIKEIAYLNAQTYAAGELKHGPIALIEENTPVVAIDTNEETTAMMAGNILEVEARGGKVFTIGKNEYPRQGVKLGQNISPYLTPFLSIIPLQMLALKTSQRFGYNVDKPRNLAKSVTVK